MPVKKQQLEPEVKQLTGSKLGKEYVKAEYCYPAYLTSMQNTSCEIPSWMKHSWIKLAGRNINNRYANDTTRKAESEEELSHFIKVQE